MGCRVPSRLNRREKEGMMLGRAAEQAACGACGLVTGAKRVRTKQWSRRWVQHELFSLSGSCNPPSLVCL